MTPLISIVDYGMGNLRSVEKALQKVGGRTQVTSSPSVIRRSAAVVLPGVGAFGEAMKRLTQGRLVDPLLSTLTDAAKPFLGICLGLQLLFERSEENPKAKGLGFLKGENVRFRPSSKKNVLKVPHMGWNTLSIQAKNAKVWMKGISSKDYFYFVHSYHPVPTDATVVAARSTYDGDFCAAAAGPSYFASQFHPEKSGDKGMHLLKNFVTRVNSCS